MKRIWLLLICMAMFVMVGGCAKKKVVTKAPPVLEEAEEAEETIDPKYAADQELVKAVLGQEGSWGDRRRTVLVVRKQSRKVTVFRGTRPIKSYPVVLGHNPRNDKIMQGDKCTPEGVYRVVSKFPHRKWRRFILLNYPTRQNWLKFAEAKRRGQIPLEAQIGGEIGIHGTEDDLRNIYGENWTEGCIALRNQHIEELYQYVQPGSLVVIQRK